MVNTNQINKILQEIKKLDAKQRTILQSKILALGKKETKQKSSAKLSVLELKGLGKELWNNVNVEKYIDSERNSWS